VIQPGLANEVVNMAQSLLWMGYAPRAFPPPQEPPKWMHRTKHALDNNYKQNFGQNWPSTIHPFSTRGEVTFRHLYMHNMIFNKKNVPPRIHNMFRGFISINPKPWKFGLKATPLIMDRFFLTHTSFVFMYTDILDLLFWIWRIHWRKYALEAIIKLYYSIFHVS
jgi:hypothetical protein